MSGAGGGEDSGREDAGQPAGDPAGVGEGRGASALTTQVGGAHYRDMAIQPTEFIHRNGLGFIEGNVIKYVCRWRRKAGVDDLRKARHYLDMLIEMEGDEP